MTHCGSDRPDTPRVERPQDLGPAVERALREAGPVIIEVPVDLAEYRSQM